MKNYRKELWFNTNHRREFINITPQVEDCLKESGIKDGFVLCNAMHITASVFINDDQSGLHHDFEVWLEKLSATSKIIGRRRTSEEVFKNRSSCPNIQCTALAMSS